MQRSEPADRRGRGAVFEQIDELLELRFGHATTQMWLGEGTVEAMIEQLKGLDADRFLVVTEDRVLRDHGNLVIDGLRALAPVLVLNDRGGETSKCLGLLEHYAEKAITWGATRRTVLIAFGGGVPGNLGGLLAALLFRGIRLVHIPTTLMAVCDSVISQKQAVNSTCGKNLLGTYYPATRILADLSFLRTLSIREWQSGLCEVIKNALAVQPDLVPDLRAHLRPAGSFDANFLRRIVVASIQLKAEVLEVDPFERGQALVFEYGHTVGHAIEVADRQSVGREAVSHGAAVGLGMLVAARIACTLGLAARSLVALHEELLGLAGVRLGLPADLPPKAVSERLVCDNKRGYLDGDGMAMILLHAPGRPVKEHGRQVISVPSHLIHTEIEQLRADGAA